MAKRENKDRMEFKHIHPGDTFKVDKNRYPEDEWFWRDKWMRTNKGRTCVNLEQGVSNQGALKDWHDDIPVVLLEKRTLPIPSKECVPAEDF
jgi:hypothetical protein